MVGGLVEDEQVATGEQHAGEVETPALPAGERGDGGEQRLLVETDAAGDPLGRRLELVPAREGEGLLQLAEAVDEAVELRSGRPRHLRGQQVHLVVHRGQRAPLEEVLHRQLRRRPRLQPRGLLPQIGGVRRDPDASGGQAPLPGDGAEQRGLPHAVRPDQGDLLTLTDEDAGIVEQHTVTDLDTSGGESEHGGWSS